MGTAPFALGSLLQLRVQTHQVVRSGAGVAQDDLPPLLADLTVVLVVGLVAVAILLWRREEGRSVKTADGNRANTRVEMLKSGQSQGPW